MVYKDPNWKEATSWLFTTGADLTSGQEKTTPASQGREWDSNPATPADCEFDALTNRQRCLLNHQ